MSWTFTTLKQAIQDYTQNNETTFVSYLDDFNFIISPTPNANSTVELHYFYRPTSITTASSGTSWLGTNAPDALLYASLCEASVFMKGEADVFQNYTLRYQESLSRLKNYGEGMENIDAYREGMVRIPRT